MVNVKPSTQLKRLVEYAKIKEECNQKDSNSVRFKNKSWLSKILNLK